MSHSRRSSPTGVGESTGSRRSSPFDRSPTPQPLSSPLHPPASPLAMTMTEAGGGHGRSAAAAAAELSALQQVTEEPNESPLSKRLSMRKNRTLPQGRRFADSTPTSAEGSREGFAMGGRPTSEEHQRPGPIPPAFSFAPVFTDVDMLGGSFNVSSSAAAALVAVGGQAGSSGGGGVSSGVGRYNSQRSPLRQTPPPPPVPPLPSSAHQHQPQAQNMFTFLNTGPLQTTLSSIIKALVTLSEQSKALRSDVSAQALELREIQSTTRASLEQIERRSREEYARKKDVAEQRYDDQRKVDRLLAAVAQHEDNANRDRELNASRVGAMEKAVIKAASDAEWARSNCAPMTDVTSAFSKLHDLIASLDDRAEQHEQDLLQARAAMQSESEALKSNLTGMIRQLEDSHQALSDAHAHHNDVFSSFVKSSSLETVEREAKLSSTVKEIERMASQTSQRVAGIMKTVEISVDAKIDEVLEKQKAEFSRYDLKIASVRSQADVHTANMNEQLFQMQTEASDVKSELSAINSILSTLEGSSSQSASQVVEKLKELEATNSGLEQKQALIRDRLISLDRLMDTKAFTLMDQLEERVSQLRGDMEKSMRSFFVTRLTEQQQHLIDLLSDHVNSLFVRVLDSKMDEVNDKIDTLADRLGETLSALRRSFQEKLDRVAHAAFVSQEIFGISQRHLPAAVLAAVEQCGRTPPRAAHGGGDSDEAEHCGESDTAEARRLLNRFVRSLPWFPSNSIQTPSDAKMRPTERSPTAAPQRGMAAAVSAGPHFGIGIAEIRRVGAEADDETGSNPGVMVTTVAADGPAYEAGIRVGDVLLSLGGVEVHSRDAFVDALIGCGPAAKGQRTPVTFLKYSHSGGGDGGQGGILTRAYLVQ